MSAPHGVVERRGLFGLSDREWGNVLVAAWGLALAAALWPAVAVALVAWAAAAATRRGWGWLAGSVAVAALPLAFGADAGALLEAAPAWKTSAALDRLGVGGWLEAVAPVCVPLGLALAAAARARQRWVGGAQGRLERRQRRVPPGALLHDIHNSLYVAIPAGGGGVSASSPAGVGWQPAGGELRGEHAEDERLGACGAGGVQGGGCRLQRRRSPWCRPRVRATRPRGRGRCRSSTGVWNDRPRAQQACGELERRHGLQVLESRAAGRGGVRGEKRGEREAGARRDQAEGARRRLERVVRGAAAAAVDEAEFVRRVRRAGVQLRPRYAAGRDDVVAGYSAALRPPDGQAAIFYGGGHLARDLTLPRLREQWPDTPHDAAAAVAEWNAARRNRHVAAGGREQHEPDPQLWAQHAAELEQLRDKLRQVPADDRSWAHVARDTAGAFAAWSIRVEPEPGPLAATAAQLARSAQLHAHQVRPRPAGLPSAGGAAMLLSSAARGGRGPVGEAALLRQLTRTAQALHDAHQAIGEARTASQLAAVVREQVATVSRDLAAARSAPAAGAEPRPPRSPVPGAPPERPAAPPVARPATTTRSPGRSSEIER